MTHQARKRFGQNFLHDAAIIARIVRSVAPRRGDNLVEIGPGQGAITLELLRLGGALTAVELDRDLIEPLRQRSREQGELTLHNADALRFDFGQLATPERPLRIIGNLPYNISTPLLFHLLSSLDQIRDLHVMLQKEVVERMAAPSGSRTYGRLSVMIQAHCQVEPLFTIAASAFHPIPKVDSAFVRLTPRAHRPPQVTTPLFAKLVASAFSQRRKTLRNALKGICDERTFQAVAIVPTLRPEQLSVADFIALTAQLQKDLEQTAPDAAHTPPPPAPHA